MIGIATAPRYTMTPHDPLPRESELELRLHSAKQFRAACAIQNPVT